MYCDADMANDRNSTTIADTAVELYRTWKPHLLAIEAEFGGDVLATLIQSRADERNVLGARCTVTTEGCQKEIRIQRIGPYLQRNALRFKSDSPGAKLLVEQLEQFPLGRARRRSRCTGNGDTGAGRATIKQKSHAKAQSSQRRREPRIERIKRMMEKNIWEKK